MDENNDPRVYFAAERTLLAWLRTGLAVVGLGFLVARFGLVMSMLRATSGAGESAPPTLSTFIGVGFVLMGTAMIAVAGWQHRRFCRQLTRHELPAVYSLWPSQVLALISSILCAALAAYLLYTSQH